MQKKLSTPHPPFFVSLAGSNRVWGGCHDFQLGGRGGVARGFETYLGGPGGLVGKFVTAAQIRAWKPPGSRRNVPAKQIWGAAKPRIQRFSMHIRVGTHWCMPQRFPFGSIHLDTIWPIVGLMAFTIGLLSIASDSNRPPGAFWLSGGSAAGLMASQMADLTSSQLGERSWLPVVAGSFCVYLCHLECLFRVTCPDRRYKCDGRSSLGYVPCLLLCGVPNPELRLLGAVRLACGLFIAN